MLDLLLADEANPRSLAFQLAALAESIDHLPRDPTRPGRSAEQRLILAALTAAAAGRHRRPGPGRRSRGRRPRLDDLLDRLEADLPVLSDALIAASYFSHLQTSRHLARPLTASPDRTDAAHDALPSRSTPRPTTTSSRVSLCHNLAHLTRAERRLADAGCASELRISPPPAVSTDADRLLRQPGDLLHGPGAAPEAERHRDQRGRASTPGRPPSPPRRRPGRRSATGSPDRPRPGRRSTPTSSSSTRPTCQRDPALAAYAAPSFPPGRPLLEAVLDLTAADLHRVPLRPDARRRSPRRSRRSSSSRRGVCQDFAHLQIGCLRSLGLAARYVSGYLLTNPPPGQAAARRRRRVARLALGLLPRLRLDRRRPDQRPDPRRTSTSSWPGAATTTTSARSRA